MAEHYFTNRPQSSHQERVFTAELGGAVYQFRTDAGVFSKDEVDPGSQLLISVLPLQPGDRVIDVGCGYGPIGLAAARMVGETGQVHLVDVNERAVELARVNAKLNGVTNATVQVSDGFEQVQESFDWVLMNPPIRAGKSVVYQLVEQAYEHLVDYGSLLLVIRKKQGAKSMADHLERVFGSVETVTKNGGYRVLRSTKPCGLG